MRIEHTSAASRGPLSHSLQQPPRLSRVPWHLNLLTPTRSTVPQRFDLTTAETLQSPLPPQFVDTDTLDNLSFFQYLSDTPMY